MSAEGRGGPEEVFAHLFLPTLAMLLLLCALVCVALDTSREATAKAKSAAARAHAAETVAVAARDVTNKYKEVATALDFELKTTQTRMRFWWVKAKASEMATRTARLGFNEKIRVQAEAFGKQVKGLRLCIAVAGAFTRNVQVKLGEALERLREMGLRCKSETERADSNAVKLALAESKIRDLTDELETETARGELQREENAAGAREITRVCESLEQVVVSTAAKLSAETTRAEETAEKVMIFIEVSAFLFSFSTNPDIDIPSCSSPKLAAVLVKVGQLEAELTAKDQREKELRQAHKAEVQVLREENASLKADRDRLQDAALKALTLPSNLHFDQQREEHATSINKLTTACESLQEVATAATAALCKSRDLHKSETARADLNAEKLAAAKIEIQDLKVDLEVERSVGEQLREEHEAGVGDLKVIIESLKETAEKATVDLSKVHEVRKAETARADLNAEQASLSHRVVTFVLCFVFLSLISVVLFFPQLAALKIRISGLEAELEVKNRPIAKVNTDAKAKTIGKVKTVAGIQADEARHKYELVVKQLKAVNKENDKKVKTELEVVHDENAAIKSELSDLQDIELNGVLSSDSDDGTVILRKEQKEIVEVKAQKVQNGNFVWDTATKFLVAIFLIYSGNFGAVWDGAAKIIADNAELRECLQKERRLREEAEFKAEECDTFLRRVAERCRVTTEKLYTDRNLLEARLGEVRTRLRGLQILMSEGLPGCLDGTARISLGGDDNFMDCHAVEAAAMSTMRPEFDGIAAWISRVELATQEFGGSAVITETLDDDDGGDILGVRERIRDFEAEVQEILNEALASRVAVNDGMLGWEDTEAETFETRQPRISEETNSESRQLAVAAEPPIPSTENKHAILEAIFKSSSDGGDVCGTLILKDLAVKDHIAPAAETLTAAETDREASAINKASSDDGGVSGTLTLKDLAAAGHIAPAAEPPTTVEADREAMEALKNVTFKKPSVRRMEKGKSAKRLGGMDAGSSGASGAPGNEEVAEEYLELLKEFDGRT
ncbi:hypothetical protein HDU96_007768 [Phlyctochytrium bullatum]|nr:hypothetical protein HDU96_007768 [Phlyctochytrium bullatum]